MSKKPLMPKLEAWKDASQCWVVGSHDLTPVALCGQDCIPENRLCAGFIVRACNAHAGLVEALKAIVEADNTCRVVVPQEIEDAIELARAAIKKAGVE